VRNAEACAEGHGWRRKTRGAACKAHPLHCSQAAEIAASERAGKIPVFVDSACPPHGDHQQRARAKRRPFCATGAVSRGVQLSEQFSHPSSLSNHRAARTMGAGQGSSQRDRPRETPSGTGEWCCAELCGAVLCSERPFVKHQSTPLFYVIETSASLHSQSVGAIVPSVIAKKYGEWVICRMPLRQG
jgi:hypothetical protein